MNTTLLKEYTTTASAGYMGAVKTEGSKSGVFLYGGELSKAIKKSASGRTHAGAKAQEKAEELTAEKQKEYEYNADSVQINHYYINKEIMLNDKAKELVKVANTVILAFNRDDSNSMIDYFDTNFYYSINIKWI